MREREIEQYLCKRIADENGVCYKFVSPAQRGVPDRVCIVGGKILFVEVKRPGELPTPLQWHHITRITKAGGLATWVDSKESVDSLLARVLK